MESVDDAVAAVPLSSATYANTFGRIVSMDRELDPKQSYITFPKNVSTDKAIRDACVEARLVVGEYIAATSYCFLLLPVAPSVSCSWLDASNTRSSKLPPSPAVSHCLPLSATRLSLLPNPHP